MITVHVKFHLNEGGDVFFQSWIKEINNEIKKQQGYLDTGGEVQENSTIGYLFLQFDTEEHLNQWVATEVHDAFFAALTPHRNVFEVAKINTDAPDYDADAPLSWTLIS
jgi:antibiotic biosynthesis monooxygenase (ABM) superfamily enzyme